MLSGKILKDGEFGHEKFFSFHSLKNIRYREIDGSAQAGTKCKFVSLFVGDFIDGYGNCGLRILLGNILFITIHYITHWLLDV